MNNSLEYYDNLFATEVREDDVVTRCIKFIGDELAQWLGEDLGDYKDNPEALVAWLSLLLERKLIECGMVPVSFSAIANCAHCGDIFIPPSQAQDGLVFECPWCANREKGRPIPRP